MKSPNKGALPTAPAAGAASVTNPPAAINSSEASLSSATGDSSPLFLGPLQSGLPSRRIQSTGANCQLHLPHFGERRAWPSKISGEIV